MNTDSWASVRALYEDALELRPEERSAFLDEHCPDPGVRREVEELLAVESFAAEHFSRLAMRVGSSLVDPDAAAPPPASMNGRMVGPYRLLDELGRGGMGVVYLAERADGAFEHRVAVKLLPVDLAGPHGHQRFLAERQILARLQHPSIARLLDGGVTDDGRPYIVMEYVDGLPIDLWCDAAAMGVDDRIKLFLEACEAIEYAHHNLVVHRDLKPSNVLVTGEAETKLLGQVKLLDFGIAKLLGEDNPELTQDEAGRVPLTPAWASPEQLAGEPVTTATDVYALTALLYRMLVGVPPHDLRGCSTEQIRKRVLTGKIVAPSQRLERLDPEQAERAATCRRSQPEALRRKLRGDLDTILLKGLSRRPEERYGSPGALAADLRRHLSGHPVTARPATVGYRVARFIGRHRPAAAAAVMIATLLGTLVWMVVRHTTSVAAERDKAEEVTELLVEVFAQSEPDQAAGRQVTARELLDHGAERVRGRLHSRPLVRASLLHTLGRVYRQLGHARRASELLTETLELRRQAGASDADRAATLHELGLARLDAGRPGQAIPHLRRAVSLRRAALGALAPAVAESLASLASALSARDDQAGAVVALREAVTIQRASLPADDPARAATLFALGMALRSTDDSEGMRQVFEEAVRIYERQPETLTQEYASSLSILASIYDTRGQPELAGPLVERAIEVHRQVYGDDHRATALALVQAAAFEEAQGGLDRAETHAREAVGLARRLSERDSTTQERAEAQLDSILAKKEPVPESR
ncbi:MAG: protein kinase domain-containing protein [Thermoanaerobaculia bacterium]